MYVHVQNGTDAGRRIVKQQIRKDWKCPSCKAWVRYYWVNCPNCAHPREHA